MGKEWIASLTVFVEHSPKPFDVSDLSPFTSYTPKSRKSKTQISESLLTRSIWAYEFMCCISADGGDTAL
ncbi:hypothetical protein EOPP23_21095 [Endozoicomonas sp. OPT23]|nr:hypothetical protein [Endozoicomonas sp. OPT23]